MQGTRGIFTRIPGNLSEDPGKCYHFTIPRNVFSSSRITFQKIPGNVQEDSEERLRRVQVMLQIPGNVIKDCGECSTRFRDIFQKIPRNVQEGGIQISIYHVKSSFFLFSFAINWLQNNGKKIKDNSSEESIFYTTTYK